MIRFETSHGPFTVELFAKEAPVTVENFLRYVDEGFFDGTVFHRVIPNFMIQGGCPLGTGTGHPGYKFNDEINPKFKHEVGTLAYANSGPDSNGCQFYITTVATHFLDGGYTIFGQVLKGQDVAVKISGVKRDGNDKPLEPVKIISIEKYEQDKQ
jgi:cyclophilin family peptidyl-prolyl cis-trans isomerase